MFEYFSQLLGQFRDVFMSLPTNRKILIFLIVGITLTSFVSLLLWANRPQFDVLYSGLSQDDAGEVVAKLREKKIPYRLKSGGTIILVSSDNVAEARLDLASAGLPRGGGVGMELFNKTSLSSTSFVQRLNYQRAIQGELERTVSKFPEIRQVRVHLNIPKESLFLEDAREPSASVVVNLYPGRSLSQSQILGIVNLVASSVEGLKTANVSVVDTAGGLLYKKEDDSEGPVLSATQIQQRKLIEKNLADRVTSMLEHVIGPNKAVTRVSAELELNQVSTTEETYDPDTVVIRSEQRIKEKTTGPSSAAGGPARTPYILGTDETEGGQSPAQELQDRTEETINYEIAKTIRRTVIPSGTIKRLSVAVMVDGNYEEKTEGDRTVQVYIPRSERELTGLENLVRHAIGADEERGDTVIVSSFQFYVPEEEEVTFIGGPWSLYLRQAVRPAMNIFLIFLFFLFVVRPLIGWIRREARVTVPERAEVLLPGAPTPALPEGRVPEPEKQLPEKIREMTAQDPDKAAELIRAWIAER